MKEKEETSRSKEDDAIWAQGSAGEFVFLRLTDAFGIGVPKLINHEGKEVWSVSILDPFSPLDQAKEVGEVRFDPETREIVWHTPIEEILARAGCS